jgi:plasmid stabilization system protein ParE
MLPLDFHPLVEADLADSAEWYGRQQPGLDDRFLAEAHEGFVDLPANAALYAIRFADIRRVNLPVFKHGVFYFIADEAVVVLAILHGHRDSQAELKRRREKFG